MPFDLAGVNDAAASTSTLRVEPAQVLQLRAELQLIHTAVEDFLYNKGRNMAMQPLGADPVSFEAADVFNENAKSALDATFGYLGQLQGVLNSLDQAVKTYNLVEDANTQTFRQGTR